MRRDINFFSIYRPQLDKNGGSGGSGKTTTVGIIAIIGCLFIVLSVYGVFSISDMSINKQISDKNAYLASPEVVNAENKLNAANIKINALKNYSQAGENAKSTFDAMPQPTSENFNKLALLMPADVKVQGLVYSQMDVALNCTCTNESSPAQFVHSIQNSSNFNFVNYTGVTKVDATTYSFSVVVTLKGGNGK